ncbi:CotD family spore coat protein [Gracilibacillus dipsosauri]|uniref:Inner spore coat protein D n=1 Tax=Gracilibacillus dipsosauri TaxID=178340 RepID=A0A317L087_9BACI|nr:CotD family spore coat protein [Gracilibacillus dipsosauri]PWU69227.1 hypothetical protein DLJ74_04355 [Gracilibacillus dipsosauri]
MGRHCNKRNAVSPDREETFVHPTRRVQNTRTEYQTVKNIHPTEVRNVNRTVIRNQNYYPVYNSDVNETVVEDYDCGTDVNASNCRRVSPTSGRGNDCGCDGKRKGWSWI